jgi:hypothetical protein
MAEREKRRGAFLAGPEWIATSAETEKNGQLVQTISNESLGPTSFSSVKSVGATASVLEPARKKGS